MPVNWIPYHQNFTPMGHMLCCVVSYDAQKKYSKFAELISEGWQINFVTPQRLSNLGLLMKDDHSYSEMTLAQKGIWNLFVTFATWNRYLSMLKRFGKSEDEYQIS